MRFQTAPILSTSIQFCTEITPTPPPAPLSWLFMLNQSNKAIMTVYLAYKTIDIAIIFIWYPKPLLFTYNCTCVPGETEKERRWRRRRAVIGELCRWYFIHKLNQAADICLLVIDVQGAIYAILNLSSYQIKGEYKSLGETSGFAYVSWADMTGNYCNCLQYNVTLYLLTDDFTPLPIQAYVKSVGESGSWKLCVE